jgi:hypothetical protein
MSHIRPELLAAVHRGREVIAAGFLALFGSWLAWQGGYLLLPLGLALAGLGLAWAVLSLRRLRFKQDGEAPGVVRVTEAQIAYMGPRIGGFIGLPDLIEIRLLALRGRRVWKLRSATGEVLHIPVEAQGAESLFDAFAGLPGMDTAALVAALGSEAPSDSKVVALDGYDRLVWARSGTGIVGR